MDSENYALQLARMLREKTVSPATDPSVYHRFHDLLRDLFPTLFSKAKFFDYDGSILLVIPGTGTGDPVLFMNHFDVVDADATWTRDPFGGETSDGVLYGRGTLDTKGGLYCMLRAAEELLTEGFTPARDVYFVSTCTEETTAEGGMRISEDLAKQGIRFAFSLDEGGMIVADPLGQTDLPYAMIAVGEKDSVDLRFVARSLGGHASRPGKNTPLVRLGKFMAALEKSKIFTVAMPDSVCEMLRRLSTGRRGAVGFLLRHSRFFRPLLKRVLPGVSPSIGAMMKTTVAFTMAGGSDAPNVLPGEAWVTGNMRTSHHQGTEASIAAVKALAEKFGVETEIMSPGFPSPVTSYDNEPFRLIERAVHGIYPDAVVIPYVAAGASDNRFMSRVTDTRFGFVPFFVSSKQLDSIHGTDESVNVSCLSPAISFYKTVISESAK